MKASLVIPERIREKFLREILDMYAKGELAASRATQMLGIPRAAFYRLLAEKTPHSLKSLMIASEKSWKSY